MNNTEHEKLHALGLAHSHEEGDHDHDHGHGHCYGPGGHHHVHSDAEKKAVLNNTGKLVLKEHIAHCIVEAIENGDEESLRQLNKAIDSFVK